jgi:hypothetical protein
LYALLKREVHSRTKSVQRLVSRLVVSEPKLQARQFAWKGLDFGETNGLSIQDEFLLRARKVVRSFCVLGSCR